MSGATPRSILDAARDAHANGLCAVPAREDGSKRLDVPSWTAYQSVRPSADQMRAWFVERQRSGLGLVCGRVSGGLEMLELEGRAVAEGTWDELRDLAGQVGLDVLGRIAAGYLERTPGGGVHLLYRVPTPLGNMPLARRPATGGELALDPDNRVRVLIETRGEGGYVIVAPSNGQVHETGRPWVLEAGGFGSIVTITDGERDELFDLARHFDRMPATEHRPPPTIGRDDRPGDRYNERPDAEAEMERLLVAHGWRVVHRREGITYLRRPGKARGISATIGRHPGLFYVFSSSTEFEVGGHRAFGVYAVLEHSGDFGAAATALAAGEHRAHGADESADDLRYYRPPELAALTRSEPDWLVRGYVASSLITELDGKIKTGKTTLLLAQVKAVIEGTPFAGYPTRQTGVLYISEQQRQVFMDALRRAGLAGERERLLILLREDLRGIPWPRVVASASKRALQEGFGALVVDTIAKLAGIVNENDAGEWAAAMAPLQDAAASGLAVLLGRHDRKGGGEVGDSGRGSSQASGDVDIIVALRRPEGNQPSNRRVLRSESRYSEVTPEEIFVELTPDGFRHLGTEEAVVASQAREFLSVLLRERFQQKESEMTEADLVERGADRVPAVKRSAIRDALRVLRDEGRVIRSGRGRRGDPYTYKWSPPGDFVSVGTSNPKEQKETGAVPGSAFCPECGAGPFLHEGFLRKHAGEIHYDFSGRNTGRIFGDPAERVS